MLFGQQAPNFWKQVEYQQVFLSEKSQTVMMPPEYVLYSLDVDDMRNYLREAPMEGTPEAKNSDLYLQIPMGNGVFETFKVWESPVMHPDLAERYPMIKSYAGRGVDRRELTVRFGYGPAGFHTIVPSANGGAITERYATYQDKYYICYQHSGFIMDNLGVPLSIQYVKDQSTDEEDENVVVEFDKSNNRGGGEGKLTVRHDYLFVLACTGEFGQMHGSDVPTVLGVLVEALNAMNALLERDIEVRFAMHPNNDQVVFLNPGTDPYVINPNVSIAHSLLGQNEDALYDIIGEANFDLGHVYSGACNMGIGGVVSGTVCTAGKARGVTCNYSSNVIAVTLSTGAHEIMHQFSGGHTFNHCPGQGGQFHSGSAREPGSGSTILSYQGSCGASNIPGPATLQYHAGNIEEVYNYTHFQGGSFCVSTNETSNHSPVVTENYIDGFTIPISTPFELEVTATDEDGDALTYSWEQMNRSPSAPLGQPAGDSPAFRVYDHNPSPIRYFPKLQTILFNTSEIVEVLPTFSKNLDFRCVVRDNNIDEGAGGVTWVDVSFKASDTAGPFRITYPNTGAEKWTAGEQVEVTWDVANTDNDIVDCQSVDLWLSSNGGQQFDYLVVAGTPNDGSEVITVPEYIGTSVRMKIKASNNIFFDVTNANFEIKPATEPTYSLGIYPQYQMACVPGSNLIELEVRPILGFDQAVEMEIVDGLPPNAIVNFGSNSVMPGESTIVDFNMDNVSDIGVYEVTLRAISGTDTALYSLFLDIVYNDFSAIILDGPVNGGSGYDLLPTYTWTDLPNADLYDFQLSTSPTFEDSTILDEVFDMEVTSHTSDFALDENTLYYWRVRPSNRCGQGDYSLKNVFQTFNSECNSKEAIDVPIGISAVGLPVIESVISVLESGTISDVNIKDLKGTHDALPDLRVTLISPEETSVVLFEAICGNVSNFELDLDDESPFEIDCPPLNSRAYKPQNPLAAFKGENTLGNWILEVAVINEIGAGGSLQGWNVEFCASVNPEHPFLLKNDTIYVKPNDTRTIRHYDLWGEDPDDATSDLRVTILNMTKYGYISKNGVLLNEGDYFTFLDIYNGFVTYTNTDPDADHDFFTFTITDGRGGLFGTPKFNIVIDENAITSVDDVELENSISLYPNPAGNLLNVRFKKPITTETDIYISEVQGRVVMQQQVSHTDLTQIDLYDLADGIYFLSVRTENGVVTERFVMQR